ncbi:MAG: polyprenol monophosphomannose synthase [Chthonomonadales bacterium]
MNTSQTLVIIPTYNERENVETIVPAVFKMLPDADLLIVDDDSPDGTADRAQELFGSDPRFHILRRTGPRGLGRSYVDSYAYALESGYSRVVQMDADFSHNPKYLPDMEKASANADVVMGSRYCPGGGVENWPFRRKLLSRFANKYVSVITGVQVRDATAGFRCYTRRALERIHVEEVVSNGYAFQVEMTYRAAIAGMKVVEIPIIFTDRAVGVSKMTQSVIMESILMPWRLRFALRNSKTLRSAPPTK